MKRFLTIMMALGVVLGASQAAMAQQKGAWDIKVGAGWFSLPDFVGSLVAGFGTIDTSEGTSNSQFIPLINPNFEIHYGVGEWFALGGSFAIGYAGAVSNFEESGAVSKSAQALYPSLCVNGKVRYLKRENYALYGSVGMGVLLMMTNQFYDGGHNRQMKLAPMANLYPLCLAIGNTSGGFVELGWGAKGFVNAGAFFSF